MCCDSRCAPCSVSTSPTATGVALRAARPIQRHRWTLGLLLLAVAGASFAGCGKEGPPLPPLRSVPYRTSDLVVRQQGQVLLLELTYPNTTMSGMPLGGIDGVELLELVKLATPDHQLPAVDPREFELGARSLLSLRGAELNATITGDRIQIRLPLTDPLPENTAQFFAVRTTKGDEASELSNRVGLIPIKAPEPPRNLEARPTAKGIELRWENEVDTAGFDVFRRDAQNRGYGEPLGRASGKERKWLDASARFGSRYIYTVRAVVQAEPLIHSAEAGEREIDFQDRFPPPLPTNFVVLPERGAVRLRWDPSPADDVAGYLLSRRDPGQDFRSLTDQPVAGIEFVDRGLVTGLTYSYRIKVVDRMGNQSDWSSPLTTTLR